MGVCGQGAPLSYLVEGTLDLHFSNVWCLAKRQLWDAWMDEWMEQRNRELP